MCKQTVGMKWPLAGLAILALGFVLATGCGGKKSSSGPVCGNGRIDEGEDCETEDLAGQSCTSLGFVSGGLGCTDCHFDTSGCVEAGCGNAVIEGGEECDSSDLGGATCKDFGFSQGELVCKDCHIDASGCSETICGDGLAVGDEQCDGDDLKGNTCESLGFASDGILKCRADCRFSITNCLKCGDGVCHLAERSSTCPADCGVVSISAGAFHTCVVKADGSVWCWGAHEGHRMGGTGDVNFPMRLPDSFRGARAAVAVAAGLEHTCYLTQSDNDTESNVWCWGRNGFGEAGATPSAEVFPPKRVDGIPAMDELALGWYHTCGRAASSHSLYCWGRGDHGTVGNDAFDTRISSPAQVLSDVISVSLGRDHSCAVVGANHNVFCWGSNERRQIGWDTAQWQDVPVQVGTIANAVAFGAGAEHSCAGGNGALVSWGSNDHGQLGLPASYDTGASLYIIDGVPEQVVAGADYTCFLLGMPGQVWCMGGNDYGQLGDGTQDSRNWVAMVHQLDDVVSLAAGAHHVCALRSDQTVRCWGRNEYGQLGDNDTEAFSPVPVAPYGLD